MSRLQPVILPDDGLRVIHQGVIGRYPVTVFHNPQVIADTVGAKLYQRIQKETAFRQAVETN